VNNVGAFSFHAGGFLAISDADWERTLALNLTTTVRMTRAALPVMLAQGSGAIVNVSCHASSQRAGTGDSYGSARHCGWRHHSTRWGSARSPDG